MNERQVKDLLEFTQYVVGLFDLRYREMRGEVIERLEAIAVKQINFQQEIKKMFSDAEKAYVAMLDEQTTRIATEIAELIASGGDKDDPEFMAALNLRLEALKKVGTKPPTPEDPIGV